MMTNTLKQHVQNLHLSGLLNSLELRLQEAEANRLPYAQFLELLLQDEINVRHQRMIARRRKSADFREPRSLENFDFGFNPSMNTAPKFMNWPHLSSCVSTGTSYWSARLVSERAIWSKPSVWKYLRLALSSFTARSSIWCASY